MRALRNMLIAAMATAMIGFGPVGAAESHSPAGEAKAGLPTTRVLKNVKWEREKRVVWCGPAAARIALSSWVRHPMSQANLAKKMVTGWGPWEGTSHVGKATNAMNEALHNSGWGKQYVSRTFAKGTSRSQVTARLRSDIKTTIGRRGRAMVVNIHSRPGNKLMSGYPSRDVYHYVTVFGYSNSGKMVYIADPASGLTSEYNQVPRRYWVRLDRLAAVLHAGDGIRYYSSMR